MHKSFVLFFYRASDSGAFKQLSNNIIYGESDGSPEHKAYSIDSKSLQARSRHRQHVQKGLRSHGNLVGRIHHLHGRSGSKFHNPRRLPLYIHLNYWAISRASIKIGVYGTGIGFSDHIFTDFFWSMSYFSRLGRSKKVGSMIQKV